MTLSDLARREARVKIFWRISIRPNGLTYGDEMVTRAVTRRAAECYGISHAPVPAGGGILRVAKNVGTYMRAHIVRNNNQILHGDQTTR